MAAAASQVSAGLPAGTVFGKTSAGFHGCAQEPSGPRCSAAPGTTFCKQPHGARRGRRVPPAAPRDQPYHPAGTSGDILLSGSAAPGHGVCAGENRHGRVMTRSHSACCRPVPSCCGLNFFQTFCFRGKKSFRGKKQTKKNGTEVMPKFFKAACTARGPGVIWSA